MDAEETTSSIVEDSPDLPKHRPDAAGVSTLSTALHYRKLEVIILLHVLSSTPVHRTAALVLAYMGSALQHNLLLLIFLQAVSFSDWQRIDAAEVGWGQQLGKPREKFVDIDKMLQAGKQDTI